MSCPTDEETARPKPGLAFSVCTTANGQAAVNDARTLARCKSDWEPGSNSELVTQEI